MGRWLWEESQFPPKGSRARLVRYAEARRLFDGEHQNHKDAKRIEEISAVLQGLYGSDAEGAIYVVMNLPRLAVSKLSDLLYLQKPRILGLDAGGEQELGRRVPLLWDTLHWGNQMRRAMGDVVIAPGRLADGTLTLRAVTPSRWYPRTAPEDDLSIEAHQIAWIDDLERATDKPAKPCLFVEIYGRGYFERKAFRMRPLYPRGDPSSDWEFASRESDLADTPWEGAEERVDVEGFDGLTAVHLPAGRHSATEIYGRSDYSDIGPLVDELNMRLSLWAQLNDDLSRPLEIVPKDWLKVDEVTGEAETPSRWIRRYYQSTRGGDGTVPQWSGLGGINAGSIREELEALVHLLCMRLEVSPQLLGWSMGRQVESGEAKSLSMSTSEAAAHRDLLQVGPGVQQVVELLARYAGIGGDPSLAWRPGLPPTPAQRRQRIESELGLGLLSRKDAILQLNPGFDEKEAEARLAKIREESRQTMQDAFDDAGTAGDA